MMTFDDFQRQADEIPYRYRHPFMIYALIKWLRPRSVVEVGTHLGMSAVWMARALEENGEGGILTCIDNFCWRDQPTQREQWERNIDRCGVRESVRLVVGRSQEVEWPKTVDFAYIDGNHSYAVACADVEMSLEHGASCLVLNDISTCEGVQALAGEIRQCEDWDFLGVPFDAGLLIALKRDPLPAPTQGDFDPWDKP